LLDNIKLARQQCERYFEYQAFKKVKCHGLTIDQKKKRIERSKRLLKSTHIIEPENILFTDEKIFSLQTPHIPQNDRIYAKHKADIDSAHFLIPIERWPKQFMVWGGISGKGKTELVFIENGVKINSENYKNNILIPHVKPLNEGIFHNINWVFQQDSAPSHSSKSTQSWCQSNLPNFISSEDWPPFSPDLNPCDFWLWGELERRVHKKEHKNLESLKKELIKQWGLITNKECVEAANSFIKRLKACVKAKGNNFEHLL